MREFLKESSKGERKVLLTPEENEDYIGWNEELFMTNLGDAVLVHFGTDGDWTRAVIIPNGEFDVEEEDNYYSPVDDDLEWFFVL